MISPLDISASALSAQRLRMNVIASNIANANTTRDAHGRNVPYRRLETIFSAEPVDGGASGVEVASIRPGRNPWRWVSQPDHPDAVKDPDDLHYGQVLMPNINPVQEMVDMMLASRAYEANLTAMDVSKSVGQAVSRIVS